MVTFAGSCLGAFVMWLLGGSSAILDQMEKSGAEFISKGMLTNGYGETAMAFVLYLLCGAVYMSTVSPAIAHALIPPWVCDLYRSLNPQAANDD